MTNQDLLDKEIDYILERLESVLENNNKVFEKVGSYKFNELIIIVFLTLMEFWKRNPKLVKNIKVTIWPSFPGFFLNITTRNVKILKEEARGLALSKDPDKIDFTIKEELFSFFEELEEKESLKDILIEIKKKIDEQERFYERRNKKSWRVV